MKTLKIQENQKIIKSTSELQDRTRGRNPDVYERLVLVRSELVILESLQLIFFFSFFPHLDELFLSTNSQSHDGAAPSAVRTPPVVAVTSVSVASVLPQKRCRSCVSCGRARRRAATSGRPQVSETRLLYNEIPTDI